MRSFLKDPEAVLDYHQDWSEWLDGDTLTSSSWVVNKVGLVIDSDDLNGSLATVWLSGGSDGEAYRVTNHIVTAAGREDDRTLLIRCRHR